MEKKQVCICCGQDKLIAKFGLHKENGKPTTRRKKCKECSKKKNNKTIAKMPIDEYIMTDYFNDKRRQAEKRNIPWTLAPIDVYTWYLTQRGKCVYTDIEMAVKPTDSEYDDFRMTIDRIDSNDGYHPYNCALALWGINRAKYNSNGRAILASPVIEAKYKKRMLEFDKLVKLRKNPNYSNPTVVKNRRHQKIQVKEGANLPGFSENLNKFI